MTPRKQYACIHKRLRCCARALAAIALGELFAFAPATALANGRFPAANHLVAKPSDPSRILLRSTFGFLYTNDSGDHWDWLCEKAVGYSGTQDPAVALTANGTTIAGVFDGLAVAKEPACGWAFASGGLAKESIIDVAVRPDTPHVAVALTGTNTGQGDLGSRFHSQVFETTDDGATWTSLGTALDPMLIVETVDVAASDPKRIYVSAIVGEETTIGAYLLSSSDRGTTWERRSIPLDFASERAPFIAAVDPKNADRVYVRSSGGGASRLLVTDDAGKTFRAVFSGGEMLGFALSPDGSKVYLGGPVDGLKLASRDELVFQQRSSIPIECLMANGTSLFACSNEGSGFIVGASQDDGATFTARLRLSTVRGPLACARGTQAAACADEWPALRAQLGVAEDAGTPSDAGPQLVRSAPKSSSCGCSVPGTPSGSLACWSAALVLAALGIARIRVLRPLRR
jgi:hypothetical protein